MSAPDRHTREQVDATLRVAEDGNGDRHDARLLAVEVRALRAELEQADHFGRGEFRVTTWAYEQALRVMHEAKAETAALVARTPQPVEPRRGGAVEAWIKRRRDGLDREDSRWWDLDCMLDDYRLHADTGTPLSGVVSEGGFDADPAPLPAVPDGEDRPTLRDDHVRPDVHYSGEYDPDMHDGETEDADGEDAEESGLLGLTQSAAQARTCSCCNGDPLTVCAACEQHACWAGRFMCDFSRTAGTKQADPTPDGEDVPARLDAAAELAALTAQRDAVLALHPREVWGDDSLDGTRVVCGNCRQSDEEPTPWPCPNARALGVES